MSKTIDRIVSATERAILSRVKSNSLLAEYYNRSSGKKLDWRKQSTMMREQEVKDWKFAIMAATDPYNPRRGALMRFYQSLRLDLHLNSCIDNRILPVQCAPFRLVDSKGDADTEAVKLLERPWYLESVKLVLSNTFEGTKLIEMFDLDEDGELARIREIPQSNFVAQDGIIVYEEFDMEGTSYKEGVYKDYYFQVGEDWNLGMLNTLAMIVLAKKLGLGSWLSYLDKYGVPPIFAITDRYDDKRRDELFEMLENFRSNQFAILQGNEKIEIPNDYNVDAYKSFEALHNMGDALLSKCILGGTGMTDEKSFVGAAKLHETLLKFRNQVDKLTFKFYFNKEIKPRLVKLSSVYAPLDKLYFEYDESETLTLTEILDAIKNLSQYYIFNVAELAKITGLPITDIKDAAGINQPTNNQKKKPNANVGYRLAPYARATYPKAATWDAAIERLASQIYSGEVKPSDLDRDLVLKNYAAFNKEAADAWGEGYYTEDITRKMRDNLMSFSGAKAYNLMSKLDELRSQKMSKELFVQEAKKMVNLHNETWMNTEKQFVSASASNARDYQQAVKDIDIYPNLICRTMEDNAVRPSHAEFDLVVAPVEDWIVAPPFGDRCRCRLEQTTEPATHGKLKFDAIDAKFRNNSGITGEVYTNENSYRQSIKNTDVNTVNDNLNIMKQYAPYNRTEQTTAGNNVLISDFYDPSDLPANEIAAKKVADFLEKDVYIRPHLSATGVKNPEFGIGKPNVLGDLKTYDTINEKTPASVTKFIKNSLTSASKQGCNYAVLDISKVTNESYNDIIARKLRGELKEGYKPTINNVLLIRGDNVGLLTREQINSKKYLDYFKALPI